MGWYIEVFGGAVWILFRKDKHASVEVYNAANGQPVNLFRCIKYHAAELQRELQWCINSRETFSDYKTVAPGLTDIQRASRFLYIIKYSYGCDTDSYGCTSKPGVSNTIAALEDVQRRLQRVVIEQKDYDRPDALFYCDPPYMGTEAHYDVRFTQGDHDHLCRVFLIQRGGSCFRITSAQLFENFMKDSGSKRKPQQQSRYAL